MILPDKAASLLKLRWNHRLSLHWSWEPAVCHPAPSSWTGQSPASILPLPYTTSILSVKALIWGVLTSLLIHMHNHKSIHQNITCWPIWGWEHQCHASLKSLPCNSGISLHPLHISSKRQKHTKNRGSLEGNGNQTELHSLNSGGGRLLWLFDSSMQIASHKKLTSWPNARRPLILPFNLFFFGS